MSPSFLEARLVKLQAYLTALLRVPRCVISCENPAACAAATGAVTCALSVLVDEEFQVFLNFSANFGMLSENLRQQLASNHQHLKQLQDTIRSSIASRPDAAGFSDADHLDGMSVRGSECSSVAGRRTPPQVTFLLCHHVAALTLQCRSHCRTPLRRCSRSAARLPVLARAVTGSI